MVDLPNAEPFLAAIDPSGDGWVSAGGPPWRDVSTATENLEPEDRDESPPFRGEEWDG